MFDFIIGLVVGATIGVFAIALVSANRQKKEVDPNDR